MKKMLFLGGLLSCLMLPAYASSLSGVDRFVDEMAQKHQFDREKLQRLFSQVKHKSRVIELMDKPYSSKPWNKYRAIFLTDSRIQGGVRFWQQHRQALLRAEQQYHVPQEVIVAIIGVETTYGGNTGGFSVLNALSTLAFDYPRRAEFFTSELENLLLLSREQGFDPAALEGSFAGAMGIPQFMPSSYRNYAVDFNGNGQADLLNEPEDAIGSVANYLSHFGWQSGQPVALQVTVDSPFSEAEMKKQRSLSQWQRLGVHLPADHGVMSSKTARLRDYTSEDGSKQYWLAFKNLSVIMRYNNSSYYALAVYQLSEAIRQAAR